MRLAIDILVFVYLVAGSTNLIGGSFVRRLFNRWHYPGQFHRVVGALELLSAAYAVHPAFGEARIVEFGAGLRPAFPDNLPRVTVDNTRISVNGLYRHGFLLAPALAEVTVAHVLGTKTDPEVVRCA